MASFPPSGEYLDSIRNSSRSLCEKSGIKIDRDAITRLFSSPAFLSSFQRVSKAHGLALPLKFPSPLSELNLLSVLSLLNFGSGYRRPLHENAGRGAWDCIRALVFSMYISSSTGEDDLLSAKGMQNISEANVAQLIGVDVYVEKPHESIPGVTVGELGGPLYDLVKLITGVLNETGKLLLGASYPDLGSFVVESLREGSRIKSSSQGPNADVETVLEKLVRFLPAFQDMAVVDGQPIYCFKKALFLIHAVSVRFGTVSPPPFPIPDTSQIPVFSDNVLPSLLIHLGVMDVLSSPSLSHLFADARSPEKLDGLLDNAPAVQPDASKQPPNEGPIITSDQAYSLRAGAIYACEVMVEVANRIGDPPWMKNIRLSDMDMWLWSVAKDRVDYRKLERFVLRETVYF
ncbi:hypothetical protein K435DRAFT_743375 [Dendrothele bispora CBS 962.96]|uniref:Queuosine 5'-phosphate N-glycosylase/hydrolase n=1 Tax=Dendrothele bispora (strain CBS 962.96) TaxID=1314807 RepID=A0A4V4HII5_DENBC|nr:hypothetical protein K435DRAFT_743375 [Dendrothele bispora CBS 962.96]